MHSTASEGRQSSRGNLSVPVVGLLVSLFGSPLLGRYGQIVEYDRQRPSYTDMSFAVLDRGRVTGSRAAGTLRAHILGPVPEANDGADILSTDGETGAVDQ
ncbi:hypothetical protein [Salinirussus salinus]|uniref:hypothetical protein n=1 Tax=Salinirussus salinus TaxID=1198300 RepID=UPI00135B95F9|nr:hypothetical protein [Salinirussus salinus]